MKEGGYAEHEETTFSRQVWPFPIHRQKEDEVGKFRFILHKDKFLF